MKQYTWIILIAVILIGGGLIYEFYGNNKVNSNTSSIKNNNLVAINSIAPQFSVPTISGQQFSLTAYKGKTVVMFGMFGSCTDCIPEGQALNQIQKTFGSKVAVIGLDVLNGEPASALEDYEQQADVNIPLATYNQTVINEYKLTQPEITYIINPDGKVAYASQSFISEANLQAQVNKVINV